MVCALVLIKIHLHLVKERDSESRISQCALYCPISLVDDLVGALKAPSMANRLSLPENWELL